MLLDVTCSYFGQVGDVLTRIVSIDGRIAVVETAKRNTEAAPAADQTRAKGVPVVQRVRPAADAAVGE